jgi:hypothetical protein
MGEHDDSKADSDSASARQEVVRLYGAFSARLLQAALIVALPIVIALRVTDAIPFWLVGVGCVVFAALFISLIDRHENHVFDEAEAEDIGINRLLQAFNRAFEGSASAIFWETAVPFTLAAWGSLLGYLFLSWTVTAFPLVLQIPILLSFGGGLFAMSAILARAEHRTTIVRMWGVGSGLFGAFTGFIMMVSWYLFYFACFTTILSDRGIAELIPRDAVSFDRTVAFYAWQALGLVPVLNTNATLRWSAPLTYVSTATGAIVLLFKVSIFVPVIGLAKALWSGDSARRDE